VFRDREHAGDLLSRVLMRYQGGHAAVVAVPRGGVPVGFPIARSLQVPLDIVIPRKLPIPEEPEAGFGAVTPDGSVVLNDRLVAQLDLPTRTIGAIVREVRREVERREAVYRQARPRVDLSGRTVVIVDDGLASGYTMLAAIKSVRKHGPRKVVVAVPCSPMRSIELVTPQVDEIYCLIRSEEPIFAVASYYEDFADLSDEQVLDYLRRAASLLQR
jgi:putative phosphoribosyl transferase